MNKLTLASLSALLTFAFLSTSALAADFNITFSTSSLISGTSNQVFNVTVGNNASTAVNITMVNITYFNFDGIAHVPGSNFTTANITATTYANFTEIVLFPRNILSWILWNGTPVTLIPRNQSRNFSISLSTPLSSAPAILIVTVYYNTGNVENKTLFVTLSDQTISATTTLLGPANNSVYNFNNVNISFRVAGSASSSYACLVFNNITTPFGTEFSPSAAPPNFNVNNNTNTNITVFFPSGKWLWNVKCIPKDTYIANRVSTGYNVTRNGLPATLNSFKVGDIINFTNGMGQKIRITFSPPFQPAFTLDLNATGVVSAILDTSPDFVNSKPPIIGPFFDNASDQFSSGFLGGFGGSSDPRFAPGVFAAANFTLVVNGTGSAGFNSGDFFNSTGGGFAFDHGPCSTEPKPAFCNPNASGGLAFDAKDFKFFDTNPAFFMTGFTDCTNPNNANKPDCQIIFNPGATITGDTASPNILFTKIGNFSDKVFLDFGTDEMSNMTLDFYGIDQYCGGKIVTLTDEGVFNPSTGLLMTNSRLKPFHHFEISSGIYSNISITSNSTYYYKTNLCDPAGNCVSSSSCNNFNSSTTAFAAFPVPLTFTMPGGFNCKFQFSNGTFSNGINGTSSLAFANMTNMTMKFQPVGAAWGIDLPASAIATASTFDFSNAFKSVSSGGKTLVGMNKTVWDALSQRLGINAINMTIVGTGNSLHKCDDSGANCKDVSSLAVKVKTDTSAGTSTWTIPVTLGFSTYVDTPPSSAAAATTSSAGGGGASTTVATTKETRTISIGAQPANLLLNSQAKHGVVQIDIAVNNPVSGVDVTVDNLGTTKPASVTSDVSGVVYRYVDISTTIASANINSSTITFNVNSSWVSDNNIDASTVALNRFSGGAWSKLKTSFVSSNATIYTFKAETPGFSTFAITGGTKAAEAPTTAPTPTETPAETPTEQTAQPTAVAQPIQINTQTWMIIGIVVVIIIVVAVVIAWRRKK